MMTFISLNDKVQYIAPRPSPDQRQVLARRHGARQCRLRNRIDREAARRKCDPSVLGRHCRNELRLAVVGDVVDVYGPVAEPVAVQVDLHRLAVRLPSAALLLVDEDLNVVRIQDVLSLDYDVVNRLGLDDRVLRQHAGQEHRLLLRPHAVLGRGAFDELDDGRRRRLGRCGRACSAPADGERMRILVIGADERNRNAIEQVRRGQRDAAELVAVELAVAELDAVPVVDADVVAVLRQRDAKLGQDIGKVDALLREPIIGLGSGRRRSAAQHGRGCFFGGLRRCGRLRAVLAVFRGRQSRLRVLRRRSRIRLDRAFAIRLSLFRTPLDRRRFGRCRKLVRERVQRKRRNQHQEAQKEGQHPLCQRCPFPSAPPCIIFRSRNTALMRRLRVRK